MPTLKERLGQYQFSTIISIAKDDLFTLEYHKVIKRINSNSNPLCLHPVVIVADPFLFAYKDDLYLFYEEQIDLKGKGVIKMSKTKDLENWTKPIVVLEENFHLSYPNVFEANGQIYMIPETGKNGTIQLYTPNDDLTQWSLTKTLISGRNFVDSSIVFQFGTYFLFTTDYTDETNILRLFWSNSIDGEWTEHPQSPIANGENTGRCGGTIFKYNSKLYRPCQLTQKNYGEGVDLYNITALNKEEYCEEYVKTIIPNRNKKYLEGGHHFNFCTFNHQNVVTTDIIEMKLNFYEMSKQLLLKIKS